MSALTLALSAFISSSLASDKISELPKRAIEKSQITLAGSKPFHLKAHIVEATNRKNEEYRAEIEEFWESPTKWRRTVTSPNFSQTLVVNGEKVSEELKGDYFPNWLRTMVSAIFDPESSLKGVNMEQSSDNPVIGGNAVCRRFAFRAGIPPQNSVFSTFCFDGALLESVGKPGYHAQYLAYKEFADKKVARKVREYIEPGTELEAKIDELEEWTPDESVLVVEKTTEQLRTVFINEETLRKLSVDTPEMQWPPIHGGKPVGILSIYVCLDRSGKVREIYALNSDHPEMSDAARKQVTQWHFHNAINQGAPIQVEGILTFAYTTKLEK
jgi:hypothetical protein